jgi:hypothetical protein
MQLADYVDREVYLLYIDPNSAVNKVLLKGVDAGGVWIEHQLFTDNMLKLINQTAGDKTPLVFVPYAQIKAIFVYGEYLSISATSLGLGPP